MLYSPPSVDPGMVLLLTALSGAGYLLIELLYRVPAARRIAVATLVAVIGIVSLAAAGYEPPEYCDLWFLGWIYCWF